MDKKTRNTELGTFVSRRPNKSTAGALTPTSPRTVIGGGSSVDGINKRIRPAGELSNIEKKDRPKDRQTLLVNDIEKSLAEIDDTDKKTKKRERRKGGKKRIVKITILLILVIALIVGAVMAFKVLSAASSVFKGSPLELLSDHKLKHDSNGRTNVLIFGTSGYTKSDQKHPGSDLTDSIMVMSVNSEKNDAYMISIPRDFYVKYGAPCTAGYEGKINALFSCYSNEGEDETRGANKLMDKVEEITGLDMHYYAHVNWGVLVKAVDSVGGVDVKIESSDPRGILDRNFDWVCNYRCYYVNYKQGEIAHLDGEHALALSRARNDAGGYGLSRGNFDREQNQQKILVALKNKAMSVGTLADINKVTGLIDAFGENLDTNFEAKEVRSAIKLVNNIDTKNIKSIDLVNGDKQVVTTGMVGEQSVVRPVSALFDYSEIASYINSIINRSPMMDENAKVEVYNASGISGLARRWANKLEEAGADIVNVANAPDGEYTKTKIYRSSSSAKENNPATEKWLEEKFNTKISDTKSTVQNIENSDYVIILYSDVDDSGTSE